MKTPVLPVTPVTPVTVSASGVDVGAVEEAKRDGRERLIAALVKPSSQLITAVPDQVHFSCSIIDNQQTRQRGQQ
jgi:phage terminase large subunit GpA-like protein